MKKHISIIIEYAKQRDFIGKITNGAFLKSLIFNNMKKTENTIKAIYTNPIKIFDFDL